MTRYFNALLVFLMILSAAAVYDMKYEAKIEGENVARLERKITQEQETISLLKAEWSTLSQPSRLEDMVRRHAEIFNLIPMTSNNIGTLDDIPAKPVDVLPGSAGGDAPGESASIGGAAAAEETPAEDPATIDDGLVR